MPVSGSIFICYRRADSNDASGRIYDRLRAAFGRDHILKDVDNIPLGADFVEYLASCVSECHVMLVIIGRNWLNIRASDGSRRLDNPHDYVRVEIESALALGIVVIPVFLEGVVMPKVSDLPESLGSLVHLPGLTLGYEPTFPRDVDDLIKGFEGLLRDKSDVVEAVSASLSPRLSKFEFTTIRLDKHGRGQNRSVGSARYLREDLGSGVFLELVEIPGGRFKMGSPDSELERCDVESPQHAVIVPDFMMGRYPVTQAQWCAVSSLPRVGCELRANPSYFLGAQLPVESVSWEAAVEFCARLSVHSNRYYRLPTEAEWEYACRGGTRTPFHFGSRITTALANYQGIDSQQFCLSGSYKYGPLYLPGSYGYGPNKIHRRKTTPVTAFAVSNVYGLCDLHGNVYEWCQDDWHSNYAGAPTDGSAWLTDEARARRVIRGGSWNSYPWDCRSATRVNVGFGSYFNVIGFRVSCSSPGLFQ